MMSGFTGLALLAFFSCNPYGRIKNNTSTPVTHSTWDELVQRHVSDEGLVNYQGFKQDSVLLRQYLDVLGENPPNDKNWTEEERKAYFINLYNAYTVQLILQHYPVGSIKDIGSRIQIPFVNTPWNIKLIDIKGEKYNLNEIEHGVIRKKFDDFRIHFAVNCAAKSCPVLHNRAYMGGKVEEQLEAQARNFINNPKFNQITPDSIQVSSIFKWYSMDLPKNTSLIDYLNQYSEVKIKPDAKVSYQDYDWSLNEDPARAANRKPE